MHIPNSSDTLKKMIESTNPDGLIICIEINWNVANAAMYIDGIDTDSHCNLGILQKLWVEENKRNHIDRCIGLKIPVWMQKYGLRDVGIRVNDCVQFVNPNSTPDEHKRHLDSFLSAGWGSESGDEETEIKNLCERGLTKREAIHQYSSQNEINEFVRMNKSNMFAVTAPSMFISYGRV